MAFTYFFRDLQTLEVIRDHVLPYLSGKRSINIWDAGCAMGQEPYSLSIILCENIGHMYFRNLKILATDIDESNLFENIITNGAYPDEQVKRIPAELLAKYFKEDKGMFTLAEEIRKSVKFKKHDLLSLVPPGNDFGLIVCKNVLLHFTEEQRTKVIRMYHDSLAEGGYLALEQTQKLPQEVIHLFKPVVGNAQVLKKI
jgi:chemotaxis protein methyltransferase CheR